MKKQSQNEGPDVRENTAFFPEGVETLITGLGSLCGDGEQVRGATTFDAAYEYRTQVKTEKEEGNTQGTTLTMYVSNIADFVFRGPRNIRSRSAAHQENTVRAAETLSSVSAP